ncbi:MAG: hypothetical protein LAT80_07305 [Balneolaceae bacterium]|nr:hypothetical protein [Balneolaceae bacterium]
MSTLKLIYTEPDRQSVKGKAKRAVEILELNINKIRSVQDWAICIGTSRSWLVTTMRRVYGRSPKQIIREIRFKMIVKLIKEDRLIAGFAAAIDSGLRDDIALSKFLKLHFGLRFTELKKLIHGDESIRMRLVSRRESLEFSHEKRCG